MWLQWSLTFSWILDFGLRSVFKFGEIDLISGKCMFLILTPTHLINSHFKKKKEKEKEVKAPIVPTSNPNFNYTRKVAIEGYSKKNVDIKGLSEKSKYSKVSLVI